MKSSAKKSSNGNKKRNFGPRFEAEKHLRTFCDATSHELATVLGTLVGELDYALTTENAISKERATMTAVAAAERALSLARNLRYFSVHTKLHTEVSDLSQIVLDSVELIEKELELGSVKITVLAEAATYGLVDPGAIQQVVLNLLANARRSMPKGGQITLSLRRTDNSIELKCSDNGHGIAERDLDYVFEPYATQKPEDSAPEFAILPQVHNLGLSVSKALIDAHGGDIHIDSKIGMGTSITVHLPYDPKLINTTNFPEGRRFRRIALSLPVEVFLAKGQSQLKTSLTTLSIGGCFTRITDAVVSPLPELNDSVSVRIHYFGNEVLEVPRARIASVSWAGTHSGLGIEFLELDGRARKLLEAIVKSHTS